MQSFKQKKSAFFRASPRQSAPVSVRGFTLFEVMVSVAIFSLVMVSVIDIFLITSKSQNKTIDDNMASTNLLLVEQRLSDLVRFGYIDSADYASGILPGWVSDLIINDKDGLKYDIKLLADRPDVCGGEKCLARKTLKPGETAWSAWQKFSGNLGSLSWVEFYIHYGATKTKIQPAVMVSIGLKINNSKTSVIEETITSRRYATK